MSTIKFAGWLFPVAVMAISSTGSTDVLGGEMLLQGEWRFAMDRSDVGDEERWFNRELPNRIQLPGILQAQGYGDEIGIHTPWVLSLYDRYWYLREDFQSYTNKGNVRVPFVSQPERHYVGVAWYQRDVEIPADWEGQRVEFFIERTRWETTVWLDDRKIGSYDSLVAPHEYDLGFLIPGKHRLTVRIDSGMIMDYRPDAHAVSDSLGSTWNGIVGRIELRSTSPVWIQDAQVYPSAADRSASIKLRIGNASGRSGQGVVSCGDVSTPVSWDVEGGSAEFQIELGEEAQLWSEFNSVVHRVKVELTGDGASDQRELVFGLRDFGTQGREFVVNGRLTHLRGTHQGGDFPLTGHPPTDVDYWLRLFERCREWGINHVRFHSFCPPDAAFTAADQVGIYLQPECGMWNVISPDTDMERMMYLETDRMIRAYGNHPSFVLFSPSNEPKGHWKESLPKWVEHYREVDPRRLYTTGTGWSLVDDPQPVADQVDYLAVHRIGRRMMRGDSAWFGREYSTAMRGVDVPNIVHENGQWCVYPDYDIIKKFTGFIQPGNFEIFRDSLAAHGLLHKNKDFAWASGRFQLACYKEEIEANLRTPGLGGFQLLDLHDYTGQGTALVGLLDPFWDPKSYVTAEEWGQFCNVTVPLARLTNRVFTTADRLEVPVEVAHYGETTIDGADCSWRIKDQNERVVTQGPLNGGAIPLGKSTRLGEVKLNLSKLPAPAAYQLEVIIESPMTASSSGQTVNAFQFRNSWKFWLYPEAVYADASADVLVTDTWSVAEAKLASGGKVLFAPRNSDLDWSSPPLDRLPVFWNRLMSPRWGRMLGLWCDTNHPALAGFPTDANCDWQWTSIIRGVRAMNLDKLPQQLQPVVQAIDDWNRNWKLGLVYEANVGRGKLMVCTVNIQDDLDERPVARQLRRSLLDYMAGEQFKPEVEVSAAQFRDVLFDSRIMSKLGVTVQGGGANPEAAIDGDPNTYWLEGAPQRGSRPDPRPHQLTVSFPQSVAMNGLVIMPRQNDRNHQGDIRDYRIEVSEDGAEWREVLQGTLASTWAPQYLGFEDTVTATHLRLTSLSGFGDDTASALAEVAVDYAGPELREISDRDIQYQRSRSTSTDVDEGASIQFPLRYDFGSGPLARSHLRVDATTVFDNKHGYGLDLDSEVTALSHDAPDAFLGDCLTSAKPFFFSAALPEGNYTITMVFGDALQGTTNTVKAESRRLMLERVVTSPGEFVTNTITVNIRTTRLADDRSVRLKPRELGVPHWDDKLTLEFNGARPGICGVEIAPAPDATTVYLLGDSTVTDQTEEPWNSWGQMLTRFLEPGIAVANHAASGESLKNSLSARRVEKVFSTLQPGDYVFVQFGHNDMKDRAPDALATYRANLKQLVADVRAKGAAPVLITSMERKAGLKSDTLAGYPDTVREVAREDQVALIDLHATSKVLYAALGDNLDDAFQDGTHHNAYGSYLLAKCIVEGIRRTDLSLAEQLVSDVPPFDPASPDPLTNFDVPASPVTPEVRSNEN